MENQQDPQNIPMTEEELDQFLKEISHQVAEPEEILEAPATPAPVQEPPTPRAPGKPRRKPSKTPSGKRSKRPGRKLRLFYLILILLLAAVFVFSAVYLLYYWIQSRVYQKDYEDMADIVASIQATRPYEPPTTEPSIPTYPDGLPINPPTEPTVQEILPEYLPFFEQNNDLVGWINVPDTKINYPVVQSSWDNKNYYIDHDFYGRPRGCGAIYVRESCDVFEPSDNVTMYGHHMKDMSMFAGLDYYWKQSFWETHQTFTFDTLFEHHTYQVFAVFRTSANLGAGFAYHQFENAATEEAFNEFVNTAKQLSPYDTGITPEFGDKLVCLSTCEYSLDNGRLVVVGVRIS